VQRQCRCPLWIPSHARRTRWDASAGELSEAVAPPTGPALSCQASAIAVNAAHTDIAAFTTALATQVGARAAAVTAADACYAANEADSANELATVARPVTGGR
jgi:hypothetical protein